LRLMLPSRSHRCRRTTSVTGSPPRTHPFHSDRIGDSGARYARHGRELVGCKSPVRKRELIGGQYTKCKPNKTSTRRRQLRGKQRTVGRKPADVLVKRPTIPGRRIHAKAARLRTETPYQAKRDSEASCRWTTKPFPTDPKVDGELVQRRFTLLFGEICTRTRE
jgi:hypothetical protein